jgi:hypothetical protein
MTMDRKRTVFAVRAIAALAVLTIAIAFQLQPGSVLRMSAQNVYVPFVLPFPFPAPVPVVQPLPVVEPVPVVQPATVAATTCVDQLGNVVVCPTTVAATACTVAISAINTTPLTTCPTTVVSQPVTTTTTSAPPSCTPMTDGRGSFNYPPGCPIPTFPPDPNSLKNPQTSAPPANLSLSDANPLRISLMDSSGATLDILP